MPSQARSLGQVTRAPEYLLCCPLFWRKSQGQVLSVSLSPQPSGSPLTLAFGEGQKEVKRGGPTASGKYLVNWAQPGGGKVKGQLQNWVSTLCKTDSVNRIWPNKWETGVRRDRRTDIQKAPQSWPAYQHSSVGLHFASVHYCCYDCMRQGITL